DLAAAGRGEVVQGAVLGTKAKRAALHVGETDERPDLGEIVRGLPRDVEAPVEDGLLEILRPALGPASEPELALVVLRHAPLAAVGRGGFLERLAPRAVPAQPVG